MGKAVAGAHGVGSEHRYWSVMGIYANAAIVRVGWFHALPMRWTISSQ